MNSDVYWRESDYSDFATTGKTKSCLSFYCFFKGGFCFSPCRMVKKSISKSRKWGVDVVAHWHLSIHFHFSLSQSTCRNFGFCILVHNQSSLPILASLTTQEGPLIVIGGEKFTSWAAYVLTHSLLYDLVGGLDRLNLIKNDVSCCISACLLYCRVWKTRLSCWRDYCDSSTYTSSS